MSDTQPQSTLDRLEGLAKRLGVGSTSASNGGPAPGSSVTPEVVPPLAIADEIAQQVLDKITELLDTIPLPKNGKDGRNGKDGEDGETGPMPDHEWDGTKLKFEKPDGEWGKEVDLRGPKGDQGPAGGGMRGPAGPPGPPGTGTGFSYMPSGW